MHLKRFFSRIKFLLRRLLADETAQKAVAFVATLRQVVESPATVAVTTITETQADDKVRAALLTALDKTDTYLDLVKGAKDKEPGEMLGYFLEQVRRQNKRRRALVYFALASELLMQVRKGLERSEADTLVQLAYQAGKYAAPVNTQDDEG